MNSVLIIILIVIYMLSLFGAAYVVEKRYQTIVSQSAWVYVLALGVYCSTWTYYGSVGVASRSGIDFLPIYLGPVIAAPLWIVVSKKMISIAKHYNITNISDFISLRYGNSRSLGAIITLLATFAIIPYIALQLKAVSQTFNIITESQPAQSIFEESTVYISVLIGLFVAFFGTRSTDTTQHQSGILFTVAFESMFKLLIFLIIGIYVTFYLFDGPVDIVAQAQAKGMELSYGMRSLDHGIHWYFMIVLSFLAIFLLPRQFQVSVVGFSQKEQLKHAIWGFPLYLLLFNIFVLFIAWGGKLLLGSTVNSDFYSILLPYSFGHKGLATLVFFGGLSAAISMIVLSTLALSIMLSNNVIIPYARLDQSDSSSETNAKNIVVLRRVLIFTLIIVSFMLYRYLSDEQSLYSIGLVSFILIAQLAPSFFIGLYWNRGSAIGAKVGIVLGSLITIFIYIVPFLLSSSLGDNSILEHGYFGISYLKPSQFLGITYMKPITHAFFWSMFVNTSSYLLLSMWMKGNYRQRNYGEIFVNSDEFLGLQSSGFIWEGKAYVKDIKEVLDRFLGKARSDRAVDLFRKKYNVTDHTYADARFVNYSERLLSKIIGNVSAKTAISSVVKEKPLHLLEVLEVLEESKQTRAANKRLEQKSKQLTDLTEKLSAANVQLREHDEQKDVFLTTVAHELKTPLTSIQFASELLQDDTMLPEDRERFLQNIMNDTTRLNELVINILNLEKLSSGRVGIQSEKLDIMDALERAIEGVRTLADRKNIQIVSPENRQEVIVHDGSMMEQVFTNILSNAIKHSSMGSDVRIEVSRDLAYLELAFYDKGAGINDADLPYIFDKFYQSKNQDSIKPEGSGFGLAIAKSIVDLHRGSIKAENLPEGGAAFYIKLPI